MDSANYNQTKTAIASGGDNASSSNYVATITLGEIIGTVSSTQYNTTLGFQADEFGGNTAPTIESLIMNATDNPLNRTNANLTAYVTATDADGDNISYAWDWRKENASIAVLNMNFDVNDSAGSGKTKDYTTYSYNGTLGTSTAEPTWNATGGWNNTGAYSFDGGDYIDMGNVLDLTLPITIESWVYVNDSDYFAIFGTNYHATNYYGVWFQITSNNELTASYGNGGTPGPAARRTKTSASTIQNNEWVHVAAVINGENNMTLYINGVDAGGTYSGTGGPMSNSAGTARIGQDLGSYAIGLIDSLRVYDYAVSAEQIAADAKNLTLITSDETSVGDNWSVCATPNDGTADGSEACSNTLTIMGDCETSADCAAGKSCLYNYCFSDSGIFTLQNGTQDVAWIDNYGRMMIAGTSSTSQGSCTGEFPIQASGSTVGAISKQGDLCLEGTMSESQSLPLASPAGGGFLVKNATSANVLYVDTSGNMALGADLIPNGFV